MIANHFRTEINGFELSLNFIILCSLNFNFPLPTRKEEMNEYQVVMAITYPWFYPIQAESFVIVDRRILGALPTFQDSKRDRA